VIMWILAYSNANPVCTV